jgi:DNA-binding NarL/FixJ family response regulator
MGDRSVNEAELIRIVVVDDHPVVRAGICAIISSQPDMVVSGEFGTADEALVYFDQARPHVVLMDLRLPGTSGLEAIRTLHAKYRDVGILVLTTYEGDEDVYQALRAGAAAYVIKGMDYERLVQGIRRVHAGKKYLPPELSRMVESRPPVELSVREREVLSLMADGKSNRAIADELGISEATVKCHVGVVLAFFGVKDRTQAVLTALRRGYVRL